MQALLFQINRKLAFKRNKVVLLAMTKIAICLNINWSDISQENPSKEKNSDISKDENVKTQSLGRFTSNLVHFSMFWVRF